MSNLDDSTAGDEAVSGPELDLRREELSIKREALDLERLRLSRESDFAKSIKSALPTVAAAFIGILGTAYVAYTQGRTNLDLERTRAEAALVLKAIETGNPEEARQNLLFLLDMGLIQDVNGRMAKSLRTEGSAVPVLPSPHSSQTTVTESTIFVSEAYPVTTEDVKLQVVIGDAQIGASAVFVDDTLVSKGVVDNLNLGSGAALSGKTLTIRTIVTDVNPETDRASVTFALRGGATGPREQTMQKTVVSGSVVFHFRVKFGAIASR